MIRSRQPRGRSFSAIPPVTAVSDQHRAGLVPTAHGHDLVAISSAVLDPYFPEWSKVII